MTKKCAKCGEEKEYSEFYKDKRTATGLYGSCKGCHGSYKTNYRSTYRPVSDVNLSPEVIAKRRKYRRDWMRAFLLKNPGNNKYAEYQRNYYQRKPYYRKGHLAVKSALRDGRLKRLPCEVCGSEKAEAHHPDYNFLDQVMWLCNTHHREWHRNNKAIYPLPENK